MKAQKSKGRISTFLPESAVSQSRPKSMASKPLFNAKVKNSLSKDLNEHGASRSFGMCAVSKGVRFVGRGSLRQAFLVSPPVEPGSKEAREMCAGSGQRLSVRVR